MPSTFIYSVSNANGMEKTSTAIVPMRSRKIPNFRSLCFSVSHKLDILTKRAIDLAMDIKATYGKAKIAKGSAWNVWLEWGIMVVFAILIVATGVLSADICLLRITHLP